MYILGAIVALFVASNAYVILRGRERHGFGRAIVDHASFLAPFNCLFYLFSAVGSRPYLNRKDFPALDKLQANWPLLREEAEKIFAEVLPNPVDPKYDLAFHSFMKRGWNRFYLSWYGKPLPSAARHCPKSVALLADMPEIRGAMFALLPDGARLGRHRDPYAGALRYHLGLETPNDDRCWIKVDGEPYSWRDGQDVIFDETYIHEAENRSGKRRIILFCDVRRPLRPKFMEKIAYGAEKLFLTQTASINTEEDRIGSLNTLFPAFFRYRKLMKRFKQHNRRLYQVWKYGALTALAGLVVWATV